MADTSRTNQLTDHFFRHSYAKVVAVLVRHFGLDQVEMAEDIVHDTLVQAMEKWSIHGVPDNPGGWIMDVAKKKTINQLRRKQLFQNKIAPNLEQSIEYSEAVITDSTLQMIFACCHPTLSAESQIALALKTLCGLSIPEIARALLTTEENITKRLYRAKHKFREGTISLDLDKNEDAARLDRVLQVLYLLFNEGYFSAHHSEKIRMDLCYEAIRLLKIIEANYPDSAKSKALLALMYLSIARTESRIDPVGELILLEDQNRALWNRELIAQGMDYLVQSINGNDVNRYQIHAGILAEHCLASDFASTNWQSIFRQYELLEELDPQPSVVFNKALAQFYLGDRDNALAKLKSLQEEGAYSKSPLLPLAQATFLKCMHNAKEAAPYFEKALSLSTSENEKALIRRRME